MKINPICFLLFFTVCAFSCYAQIPIQWENCYGGTNDDNSRSICPTRDGGYAIAGSSLSTNINVTNNNGFGDYWIIKLNKDGVLEWQKSLGGSGLDVAYCIQQTNDEGYIICGYTISADGQVTGNHGSSDYWIVKLDKTGNLLWQKTFGGSGYDNAHCIRQTSDGGYITAGGASSTDGDVVGNHGSFDAWVLKLDANGNITWKKCYGGSGIEDINDIMPTNDGGYIMTGYTTSTNGDIQILKGKEDLWVIKTDANGNMQWQKTFGGADTEDGKKIILTGDGGYMIAGMTNSLNGDVTANQGNADAWLLKLDANGNKVWQQCYGGTGTDAAISLFKTNDNKYIIGGQSSSIDGNVTGNHGVTDFWIFKIDENGVLEWQKCYGGSNSDLLSDIIPTTDGWFIASGSTNSKDGDVKSLIANTYDYWIVKFGQNPSCLPTPVIVITSSHSTICSGDTVIFTASVTNNWQNQKFQWQLNGINTGINNPIFKTSMLSDGDKIQCILLVENPACPDIKSIHSNIENINVLMRPSIHFPSNNILITQGEKALLQPIITGTINSFTWEPSGALINPSSLTTTTIQLNNDTIFTLNVKGTNGCITEEKIIVRIFRNFYMPNAFTPNNDGKNDLFIIPDNTLLELEDFSIYERGGNKIFSTKDIRQGWNGSYKGRLMPSGVFVYSILGKIKDKKTVFKGTFTLIR